MKRIVLLIVVLLLAATPSWARWRLDKKEFKPVYQEHEMTLPLRGVGVKTLWMMRIFVAGLYMDEKVPSPKALEDVAKHLEVRFFATISAKDFTKYTIERMKANLTRQEFNQVADRFKLMGELFPNIQTGDVFSLTYKQSQGTYFTFNGQVRGIIPGADFAKAIFSTWFGPKPIDQILKKQVLGVMPAMKAGKS